jgi:ribonuclease VapC
VPKRRASSRTRRSLRVTDIVLDASAVLVLMHRETGAEPVKAALPAAVLGSVNLAEVVTKLVERGMPPDEIADLLQSFDLDLHAFDDILAFETGVLRASTRGRGLSLGDRACLALARRLGASVLTADRAWQGLDLGVPVELLR